MGRYQRHKHPLGDSTTDGDCHRHDNSRCPAGHTEQGRHGSQDCRKDDAVDSIFTRIQHMFKQSGKAALEAIEAIVNDLGEAALEDAEIRQEADDEITAWLKHNRDAAKRHWNGLLQPVRAASKAGTCAVLLGAAALDPEPTSKVTLIAVLSAMGCALLIDDIEDLILGSDDDNPPREGGTAAARPRPDPTTTAPPTTAVPFDPENDCDTWFAGIRACITIDKEDGMATITYH